MRIGELETHPAADAFPLLSGDAYERFRDDVKANGLLDREIWRLDGKILDGRNRIRVALELGLEPEFRDYKGDDAIGFVVSRNMHRRHLNESQRAIVAAKLATLPRGRPRKNRRSAGLSAEQAAALLGSSERHVERARGVLEHAVPDVVQAVERGELALTAAEDIAKRPPTEQLEALQRELAPPAPKADAPDARDPVVQLERTIRRALEQFGATIGGRGTVSGFRIAYAGRQWLVTVEEAD